MPNSLGNAVLLSQSSLLLGEERTLLQKKVQIDRELKARQKKNPLEYYWPHALGCDGHSCRKVKHAYKDYYGTEYTIEGCPQFAFHTSLATTRGLFGGNRSGKTTPAVVEVAIHLTGQYPDWWPKTKRWPTAIRARFFTTDFKKGVGEVVEPKIAEWFPEGCIKDREKNNAGVYDKYWIKHESGKLSSMDVMTYEQSPTLAEGWSGHLACYDECPPQAHRIATLRGLTDYFGWEMFTATPVSEPYLYDEIYASKDADVECFTMDIRHNSLRPNPLTGGHIGLTEEAIRRYERSIKDAGEFDARIHGKFKYLTGRIWKIWDRNIHGFDRNIWTNVNSMYAGQPPRHWKRVQLIDPHDEKPHALIWAAMEPDYKRWFIYREAWLKNCTFKQVCKHIMEVEVEAREKVDLRIMDPNFGPKTQGNNKRTVRDDFEEASRDLGYPMQFRFGDDHKERGRKKVEELMWYDTTQPISLINRPILQVANDLVNCIYQVEHYVWDTRKFITDKDPKEQPKDLNTDFPDLLHYLALLQWTGEPAEVIAGHGSMYTGG